MMEDLFKNRAIGWDSSPKVAMSKKFVHALLDRLDIHHSWRAMEMGAGTGLVGMQLLPRLGSLVFEDPSLAMLEVLKEKLKGDEPVEFLCDEVNAYQQTDLNLVFSCMAFHHIDDVFAVLQHLNKLILPGGYLAVGDLCSEDGSFHDFANIAHHGFEPNEFSQLIVDCGFHLVSVDVYHRLRKERADGKVDYYDQFLVVAQKPFAH